MSAKDHESTVAAQSKGVPTNMHARPVDRGVSEVTEQTPHRPQAEKPSRQPSLRRPKPRRDFWDKVGAVAPLVQALALGLIGFIGAKWTSAFNSNQLNLQRATTAEKFFPHLLSQDDRARRIALVTLGAVDSKLAVDLSTTLGAVGIAALGDLAQSPSPPAAAAAISALKVAKVATVTLARGAKTQVRVLIGRAQFGNYHFALWNDAAQKFLRLSSNGDNADDKPDQFDLGSTEQLNGRLLQWNVVVFSSVPDAKASYFVKVTITQNDKAVPGGTFDYKGALDGSSKTILDTVRLDVS